MRTNVKNPTLTSNSATSGWGTLEISAGDQGLGSLDAFAWATRQARYYDFNVWSERKPMEELNYMHLNPVKRGLVTCPEDRPWSSFRHYATGCQGIVEIESQWTARRREILGLIPKAIRIETPPTRAKPARVGHRAQQLPETNSL